MIAAANLAREDYLLPDNKASFSSLQAFHDCPECWYLKYVKGLPTRTHVSLPRGGAVHEGLKFARERVLAGKEAEVTDAVDVAVAYYEKDIEETPRALLDMGEYADHKAVREDVSILTKAAVEAFIPHENLWLVECRLDFDGVFPFAFEGYADAITKTLIIKDCKTAGKAGAPDAWNRLQLLVYGLPFVSATALLPRGRIERVWPRNDRLRGRVGEAGAFEYEFTEAQFNLAKSWVLQTAGSITDAMRSGDFPARPSFRCKFNHFEEVA